MARIAASGKTSSMKSAYLKMHAAIFLWGFTGLLGKLIHLNEGLLVWYRMMISSVVIGLLLLYRKALPKMSLKEILLISCIGFIVMLHWVTFYGSIKLSSISVAMICLSSIALFASVLEPVINRQRLDFTEVLFSILAMAGISSIYFSDASAEAGVLVGVTSSFFSALFSVFNRRIASKYEPLTISFIELGAGFIFLTALLPLYLSYQPSNSLLPNESDWYYLLILSILCTVLTWILSLQALRKVSAYTMALALNLEPVYGIILAVLFAEEGKLINGRFIIGALIILVTVIFHTIYKFRKNKAV
jgi:drug/metabolite transporter (DMT)-like permease